MASSACDLLGHEETGRLQNAAELRGHREYDIDPARAAETGHEIFVTKCSSCHGPDAEGRVKLGPRLASKSLLEAASDKWLGDTIRNGRAGTTMVAWGAAISDQELGALIAYVRSTVPHEPAELDESALDGSAESGSRLFHTICASCHGNGGGGYTESSGGTGIGRKAFLASVSDGFLRHVIKNGKSQTPMRGFDGSDPMALANLGDPEVDAIISFLRREAW